MRTITRAQSEAYKALFTACRSIVDAADKSADELLALLKCEHNGHLDDALYSGRISFDEALKREEIRVRSAQR
jgi:hypothetical protein